MFLDDVGVTVAMITVTLLAVLVVVLKVSIFSDKVLIYLLGQIIKTFVQFKIDPSVSTFKPLDQQVKSIIKYTGNGFIPCEG